LGRAHRRWTNGAGRRSAIVKGRPARGTSSCAWPANPRQHRSGRREGNQWRQSVLPHSTGAGKPATGEAGGPRFSSQDLLDHAPRDIGQAEIATVVAVRQLLMIQADQMQDGRVQVVDADAVLDGLEADLVSRAVMDAALHSAAGHPDGERMRVVV